MAVALLKTARLEMVKMGGDRRRIVGEPGGTRAPSVFIATVLLLIVEFERSDDARICCRGERSDWRTIDCGVVEAGTFCGGDDNERGAGEESGRPGSRGGDRGRVRCGGSGRCAAAVEGGSSHR